MGEKQWKTLKKYAYLEPSKILDGTNATNGADGSNGTNGIEC